jgi:hypothetical protein
MFIVRLLILCSQCANVVLGGSEDEMLCSRAWRLRGTSQFWQDMVTFFDKYCWPLSQWTGDYDSHCKACYMEEMKRLEKRMADYWSEL